MLVFAAGSIGSLLVAGGGVVLGVLLVGWGLAGRALRLKRERAAAAMTTASEDPRVRALEARVSRLEGLIERARGEIAELKTERNERAEPANEAPRPVATREGGSQMSRTMATDPRRPEPKPLRGEAPPEGEFAEVFQLADQGLNAAEIARRLERPTGQVELILNLRRHGIGA